MKTLAKLWLLIWPWWAWGQLPSGDTLDARFLQMIPVLLPSEGITHQLTEWKETGCVGCPDSVLVVVALEVEWDSLTNANASLQTRLFACQRALVPLDSLGRILADERAAYTLLQGAYDAEERGRRICQEELVLCRTGDSTVVAGLLGTVARLRTDSTECNNSLWALRHQYDNLSAWATRIMADSTRMQARIIRLAADSTRARKDSLACVLAREGRQRDSLTIVRMKADSLRLRSTITRLTADSLAMLPTLARLRVDSLAWRSCQSNQQKLEVLLDTLNRQLDQDRALILAYRETIAGLSALPDTVQALELRLALKQETVQAYMDSTAKYQTQYLAWKEWGLAVEAAGSYMNRGWFWGSMLNVPWYLQPPPKPSP